MPRSTACRQPGKLKHNDAIAHVLEKSTVKRRLRASRKLMHAPEWHVLQSQNFWSRPAVV